MTQYDATSTADDVLKEHDLSGTTVLVTGAASGIGFETARAMAAHGGRIILAGRDEAKLSEAGNAIDGETDTLIVDLASLKSIAAAGRAAREQFHTIDILVNNAGVMACPLSRTEDGFEMQFGTNHLGHFALTAELMPLLAEGARKRIVTLSSRAHHRSAVDLDDPHYRDRAYEKWEAYGQSKTANVLFTVALQTRLAGQGFDCFAVHPGGIRTNLGRHLSEQDLADLMAQLQSIEGGITMKSPEQGAATTCWAATAPQLKGQGGAYCEDCHIAPVNDENEAGGVRSYATDPDIAEHLWTLSESETGAVYDL